MILFRRTLREPQGAIQRVQAVLRFAEIRPQSHRFPVLSDGLPKPSGCFQAFGKRLAIFRIFRIEVNALLQISYPLGVFALQQIGPSQFNIAERGARFEARR